MFLGIIIIPGVLVLRSVHISAIFWDNAILDADYFLHSLSEVLNSILRHL